MSSVQAAKRVAGADIATGAEVKLIPGGAAELIDLSGTGALVETPMKLATGVPVTLSISGPNPQRLAGRTVRCQVCAIHRDSTMTYQIAIAFDQPAPIDAFREPAVPSATLPEPPTVAAAPGVEAGGEPVNEW